MKNKSNKFIGDLDEVNAIIDWIQKQNKKAGNVKSKSLRQKYKSLTSLPKDNSDSITNKLPIENKPITPSKTETPKIESLTSEKQSEIKPPEVPTQHSKIKPKLTLPPIVKKTPFATTTIKPKSPIEKEKPQEQIESPEIEELKPKTAQEIKPEFQKSKEVAQEALKEAQDIGLFSEDQLGVIGREIQSTYIQRYNNELAKGTASEEAEELAKQQAFSYMETVGNNLKAEEAKPRGEKPKKSKSFGDVRKPTGITLKRNLDNERTLEQFEETFGKEVDLDTLGALVYAPDGTKIEIFTRSVLNKPGTQRLVLSYQDDKNKINAQCSIQKDKNGSLISNNQEFIIEKDSPFKGRGLEFALAQVEALKELGVKKMICMAVGYPGGDYNGYITWPKFGYGGNITQTYFNALPEKLREQMGDSREILDLMDLEGGAAAWEQFGGEIANAYFDLTDGSRSMKRLTKYLEERKNRNA